MTRDHQLTASYFNRTPKPTAFCSLAGCERPAKGRGLCTRHYRRWQLYGDPLAYAPKPERRIPTAEEIADEMRAALARLNEEVPR
jgi:hypothetical protein